MADKKDSYDNYKIAIELVKHEGQLLWFIFGGFSVLDSAILIFAIKGHIFFSILGLALTVVWILSYIRSYNMYVFRITQAREIEPEECTLLKDGRDYSEGKSVPPGKEGKRQPLFGRIRTGYLLSAIFLTFIILYALLIFAKAFNCNFLQL